MNTMINEIYDHNSLFLVGTLGYAVPRQGITYYCRTLTQTYTHTHMYTKVYTDVSTYNAVKNERGRERKKEKCEGVKREAIVRMAAAPAECVR